jgi:hypothetical protein
MDAEIKREFDKLHRVIKELVANKKKETWITPTWVFCVTGWDKLKLRQAREQGIVEYRKSKTGEYEYKLESIPEQFIIKKQAV